MHKMKDFLLVANSNYMPKVNPKGTRDVCKSCDLDPALQGHGRSNAMAQNESSYITSY